MKGDETMTSRQIEVINQRGEVLVVYDGIVPPGCRLRVPFMLMDGVQQGVAAQSRVGLTDAFGNPAGFRPGYVFAERSSASDARDAAFAERTAYLNDAWRGDTPSNAPQPSATLDDRPSAYEAYRTRLSN